jgi:3-oxoacyl-[acyl-carrier protein] reductase
MDLGVAGRVALVTGGSDGLGLASALTLAAEGADVTITGRRPDRLAAAAETIRARTGRTPLALAGDITDPEEPTRAVAATVERFGRLDILVPNAGGPPARRALDVTDDEIAAAVNANLTTTVRLVRQARAHLAAHGAGRICVIASYSVLQPIPMLSLSNLARVGLWGWAKTAAQDLVPEGTTLNVICPGPHRTARAASLGLEGRAGDPGDFGQAVAFLCSDAARFITATTLVVDGGQIAGL